MYLRKTIALVVLAAATAAPSALAKLPPEEGLGSGLNVVKHGVGRRPKVPPHKLCHGRQLQLGHRASTRPSSRLLSSVRLADGGRA